MTITKINYIGGTMSYSALTNKLDERTYDIGKAHIWLGLIQDYKKPVKWNKSTSKGTGVKFETLKSKEEIEVAFDEYEVYLKQVNKKHGTDLSLVRPSLD